MTEEVLIKVELPNAEANDKRIDELTASIASLNKETKALQEENKKLEKTGQDNSKQYLDNAKQIEINKQKIQENSASRKGLIQTIIAEDNSIKGLRVQNAELIKQRDSLNTKTKEGQAAIQKINNQIDANTKEIAKNSSSMEKQKMNIGNYKSALDGIIPGFSGFSNGIQTMITAGKAFIATPIGIALAAIAAVIATVSAAIKTNDEVADAFNKIWAQINATFDVALRRVGLVGEAISKLVTGDFVGAWTSAKNAVTGFVDEVNAAVKVTGDLQDRQNKLDDDLNKFHANEAARENEANKLRIQSRNSRLSVAEAQALINKASEIDKKLTEDRIALTQRQSDIDIETIGLKHNLQRQLNESTQEYGNRLLDNATIGGEEAKKIADALNNINTVQASSIVFQEKLANQSDKLSDKEIANAEKVAAAKEKAAKEEEARQVKLMATRVKLDEEYSQFKIDQSDAEIERLEIVNEDEYDLFRESLDAKYALLTEQLETETAAKISSAELTEEEITRIIEVAQGKRLKLTIDKNKQIDTANKKLSDANKSRQKQELDLTEDVLNQAASLFKKNTIAYKALAITLTIIDTVRGITRALADYTFPYSLIVAALVGVAGTIQTAKIAGLTLARGGILIAKRAFGFGGISDTGGLFSGPSHAQGGIPGVVGSEMRPVEFEGGEAIINKRSTSMFRDQLSAINVAGGGVSFQTGGVMANETRLAAQSAQSFDVNQLAELINFIQPVLVREDYELADMQHKQTISRAKVI